MIARVVIAIIAFGVAAMCAFAFMRVFARIATEARRGHRSAGAGALGGLAPAAHAHARAAPRISHRASRRNARALSLALLHHGRCSGDRVLRGRVDLLQALSPYATIARLNAAGVHPVASRKTRVECAWSAKPSSAAIVLTVLFDSASARFASSTRSARRNAPTPAAELPPKRARERDRAEPRLLMRAARAAADCTDPRAVARPLVRRRHASCAEVLRRGDASKSARAISAAAVPPPPPRSPHPTPHLAIQLGRVAHRAPRTTPGSRTRSTSPPTSMLKHLPPAPPNSSECVSDAG